MSLYNQLTLEKRYTIFELLQASKEKKEIASIINVSHSTVCREINRNSVAGKYDYKLADKLSRSRREAAKKPVAITAEIQEYIEEKLKSTERWSPEQIAGRARLDGMFTICKQTIYSMIHADKKAGGNLYKYLRRKRKYKKSKGKENHIKNRVSIDERPAEVDEKNRFGDWEADTVVSCVGDSTVILTLVERKSRFTRACMLENRKSDPIAYHICRLLRYDDVKTITSDNGTEFASHLYVSKELATSFYFAHPYHSWERGCNENTNGLIRHYLPKGKPLKGKYRQLSKAIIAINNRPRKSLGYRTPREVYEEHWPRAKRVVRKE